ncbi:MAG: hypothetical protein ACTSUO_05625 [Candidatus Thorarchaeota archaeon]
MARKRTKAEALDRLSDAASVSRGLKGKPKIVRDAALLGAAGLIMLDPFNRLADEKIVLPLDMVCIPAYQAYMIQGSPSMQIYVRAGETIIPTGGNVRDVEEALGEVMPAMTSHSDSMPQPKKRKVTAYQREYKKAFKSIAPKHKLKNGKWKKGGFKAAVKAAHKKAGGKK